MKEIVSVKVTLAGANFYHDLYFRKSSFRRIEFGLKNRLLPHSLNLKHKIPKWESTVKSNFEVTSSGKLRLTNRRILSEAAAL